MTTEHGRKVLWRGAAAVCAAAAVLTAWSAARAQDTAGAGVAGLRVAVVDMSRVLRGSQEWGDSVDERARIVETRGRTVSKLRRQVQLLRNEHGNRPPGSPERRQKAAEVEIALQELDRVELEFDTRLARQLNGSARSLLAKLNVVVADYAREHGIHLVLKKQDMDLVGPDSVEQSLQMATTEVLYADPALDISDAVIETLNAEYPGPIEVT